MQYIPNIQINKIRHHHPAAFEEVNNITPGIGTSVSKAVFLTDVDAYAQAFSHVSQSQEVPALSWESVQVYPGVVVRICIERAGSLLCNTLPPHGACP